MPMNAPEKSFDYFLTMRIGMGNQIFVYFELGFCQANRLSW